MTVPRERKLFVDQVWELVTEISQYDHHTPEKRLSMLAFSILSLIDGEGSTMQPYELRPLDGGGVAGEDIAGNLHSIFYDPSSGEDSDA